MTELGGRPWSVDVACVVEHVMASLGSPEPHDAAELLLNALWPVLTAGGAAKGTVSGSSVIMNANQVAPAALHFVGRGRYRDGAPRMGFGRPQPQQKE